VSCTAACLSGHLPKRWLPLDPPADHTTSPHKANSDRGRCTQPHCGLLSLTNCRFECAGANLGARPPPCVASLAFDQRFTFGVMAGPEPFRRAIAEASSNTAALFLRPGHRTGHTPVRVHCCVMKMRPCLDDRSEGGTFGLPALPRPYCVGQTVVSLRTTAFAGTRWCRALSLSGFRMAGTCRERAAEERLGPVSALMYWQLWPHPCRRTEAAQRNVGGICGLWQGSSSDNPFLGACPVPVYGP